MTRSLTSFARVKAKHRRLGYAVLVSLIASALLVATAPGIGVTWDEPVYIVASESYVAWLGLLIARPARALRDQAIVRYWEPNHEHPPLDKVWSGLVWSVARLAFGDLTAHRLGNMLLAGALVGLLYDLIATTCGQTAGLFSAAALLTMPRFFFHAHLAALDVPAAFSVFAVVYLFWFTKDRPGATWNILLGVTWGLAMATKINAVFVPPILLLWTLAVERRARLPARVLSMASIGLPLSLLLWPWMYHQFPDWLAWYVRFVTVDHWEIGQWYLGRFYMPPPWHFSFAILAATVPPLILALAAFGAAHTQRDRAARPIGTLLILCALVPVLVLAVGRVRVYDNDRLFAPILPFVAGLAGVGYARGPVMWFASLRNRVSRRTSAELVRPLLWISTALPFVPHLLRAYALYPHLLSYYTLAVGGLWGATRLGFETTYWCDTYVKALPYLNAHARPGSVVWVQDWSHDVMIYYQVQGLLRRDLRFTRPPHSGSVFEQIYPRLHETREHPSTIGQADYVVLQYRQTGWTRSIATLLERRTPAYRFAYRGIPLLEIYDLGTPAANAQ